MGCLGELVGVNVNASVQGSLIESVAAGRRQAVDLGLGLNERRALR
jgi:hypothetical protein